MPDEMERARAARALLVDARKHDHQDQAEEEMAAFMAIFHPGHAVPSLDRSGDNIGPDHA